MGHLDPNASHSRSNINKALRGGQGYKLVNRLVGNQNYRQKLLKHMGASLADVEKIRSHIAAETHQMGRGLKSKKQILQHYRGKWGLSDTDAKQLLQAIAPESTGLTKEQLEKRTKTNLKLQRLSGVGSIGRIGQYAGRLNEKRGDKTKEAILAPRIPGKDGQSSGGLSSVTSLAGHNKSDVTAGSQVEATGVVGRSGKLEVKEGGLKVERHEAGTGLAGGKPTGGVASIHELRTKKKADEEKTQTEHHDDASHQIPLAA